MSLGRSPLASNRTPMKASETALFRVYLHELFMLAKSVRDRCDAVFSKTAPPASGYYINVDPELHSSINGILIDAANIKKLIHTGPKRRNGEAKKVYDLRQQRSHFLADLLVGIELEDILDTKVRNTLVGLTRFDGHLINPV